MARAASALASDVRARAIAVLTATGETAKRISQRRPGVPILAFADRPEVAALLSLWQGVVPVHERLAQTTDELIDQIGAGVRRLGYADSGDRIVIVGSVPRANGARAVFLEVQTLS